MSATVANSPYSRPYPDLKRYLRVSGICHVVLIGLMVLSAFFKWPGNQWAGAGGGGDNIKVNLVGSAGMPLPKQPGVRENNGVEPTKRLNKEEEKPKPPEPPRKGEKNPHFEKKRPPLSATHK